MKKVLLFLSLGIALLWAAGIVLENVFDVDLEKFFTRDSPATQVAAAPAEASPVPEENYSDWKTYKNDDFHFSIRAPFELYETKSSEPTTVKSLTAKGHSDDMKFVVQVMGHEMPGAGLNLGQVMDQEIKAFKLMDKIFANLQISSGPATVGDTPGILAVGTYQIMGKYDYEMQTLKVMKGTAMIDFLVQYPVTDANKAQAGKIIQSLSFTN